MHLFQRRKQSSAFLRATRVARIVRVLRLVKVVKVFSESWLLVESFLASLPALVWSSIVLCVVFFIFGLIAMQGARAYIENSGRLDSDNHVADQVRERFGSMRVCMISMFKSGTGGQGWEIFYDLQEQAGWFYSASLISFIFCGIWIWMYWHHCK